MECLKTNLRDGLVVLVHEYLVPQGILGSKGQAIGVSFGASVEGLEWNLVWLDLRLMASATAVITTMTVSGTGRSKTNVCGLRRDEPAADAAATAETKATMIPAV